MNIIFLYLSILQLLFEQFNLNYDTYGIFGCRGIPRMRKYKICILGCTLQHHVISARIYILQPANFPTHSFEPLRGGSLFEFITFLMICHCDQWTIALKISLYKSQSFIIVTIVLAD